MGLYIREKGAERRVYASELSDGTLRTLGIFLPVLHPKYSLVVIEEPENCLHPWVIRKFVDVAREQSRRTQIILTTHSPVLVSSLEPNELMMVERDTGRTKVTPAVEVETGLEDIIRQGIVDLGSYWDSGAMRAVPSDPMLFSNGES